MNQRVALSSVLVLAIGAAHAGTVLETVNRDLPAGADSKTHTMMTYAQDGKMRVETKPGDTLMIFKDETIFTVNHKEKSYYSMDRAAMKRMADQVNPALEQMQDQLAKMSPEQRAQMEKMMGSRLPGMGKQKSQEIRKTARTDKIGGYTCSYVEVHEDGVLSDELCVVPPGTVKGSQDLMDAAVKMSALLKEMLGGIDAPWLKQSVDKQVADYEKLGGLPLLTRHYSGGQPASETTLKSIRNEPVPAALFEIPAGYAKKEMMARK